MLDFSIQPTTILRQRTNIGFAFVAKAHYFGGKLPTKVDGGLLYFVRAMNQVK